VLPSILNRESTIGDWQADPRGQVVFEPFFQQFMGHGGGFFGSSEEGTELVGMDPMEFLTDMTLRSVLHFQDSALPQSPEEIVDNLLQQVYANGND
jgi:hypothetical protein